jgi:benzoate-CoA ligase family protein
VADYFNACTYLVDRQVEAGRGAYPAVRCAGRTLSYAELADETAAVAAGLKAIGVRPEERVMLLMLDGVELLTGILGAMRMGAVAVPISTMLTGHDLTTLLRDSRARTLLASAELGAVIKEALPQAPDLSAVVVAGAGSIGAPSTVDERAWGDFRAAGESPSGRSPDPDRTVGDSPALWLYTSGTTGMPKGAMHRHANFRHVVDCYSADVLRPTTDDVCFSVAKLFFAYGLGNSMIFPLAAGASAVLDPARPTPASVAERLRADRPTLFFATPSFYAALVNAQLPADAFGSVRMAVSAGEPLPAALFARFRDRYGVDIIDGLGSTEALHIFLSNRPDDVRPGTTGKPVQGYELALRDADGAPVPDGQPGNLFVRGPSTATGYWCRVATTRDVFQGQWLRTGDVYVRSEDGYYTCLGRSDDMLKAGGIWVSPAEVEGRLLEHPSVAQAAVVGVPDEHGIDKPVAYVVPATGAVVDPDELIAFAVAGLAAFKRPRRVFVVDDLPRTATGKLRRFAVRKLAIERLKAEAAQAAEAADALQELSRDA